MELSVTTEEKTGRFREYTGVMAVVVKAIAIGLPSYTIAYSGRILHHLGLYLTTTEFVGLFLSWLLVLVFLMVPASKREARNRLPWSKGCKTVDCS